MNETVRYLCEFFFCHFWHFIGLWIIVATVCGTSHIHINKNDKTIGGEK